ncbi:MAG: hypothetical protein Q8R82_14620 [Hyphomonadaceae bacterium]|nr:hypothetical protein [Hyphomonadaceae bacterium]
MKSVFAGVGFGLLASAASADAQTPVSDTTGVGASASETTYGPEFYARYSPRSALDMVQQTPGFTITEGAEKRGLGQGGANVLINSQRISSKATSALDALARIAADRVVRIEIVDGARLNIPGLSGYVVNVITRGGALTGRWEWSPEFRQDRTPKLEQGKLFVSGDFSGWNYTAALSSEMTGDSYYGYELARDNRNIIFDTRIEHEETRDTRVQGSLDLSHEALDGAIANIRMLVSRDDKHQSEVSDRFGTRQSDRVRFYDKADESDNIEIGGDYEFGLGPGRLKLIGLYQTRTNAPVESATVDYLGVSARTGSRADTESESGESILRGEYSLSADNSDWQVSLEGAFNYLDTSGQLFALTGNDYVVVPLPGTDSRVEERRAETSLVHGRPLNENLSVQASLGAEYSELAQTGANGLTREFVRPKGFVALSWNIDTQWDATFRVERTVGQLDFADFVTSVMLNNDQNQTNGGNPNLVPEQSWDTELVVNGQTDWTGPVKVRFYYRDIEDLNDKILIERTQNPDGSIRILEGAGNLESAIEFGIELSGTYSLSALLPGAKVDWLYLLSEQRVEDPITGQIRMFSQTDFDKADIKFRQDIPNSFWAWGVDFLAYRGTGLWRVDQRFHRLDHSGALDVYVQNKNVFGLDAKLRLNNLLDEEDKFHRLIYAGTRADPLSFRENRLRHRGQSIVLTISGGF